MAKLNPYDAELIGVVVSPDWPVVPPEVKEWWRMGAARLPSWLPEWQGAEGELRESDVPALRLRAQELVDLILTEDTEYLDALPEKIESEIITPLVMLSDALDDGTDLEVVVAWRLVRRAVDLFASEAPEDLRRLIGISGGERRISPIPPTFERPSRKFGG